MESAGLGVGVGGSGFVSPETPCGFCPTNLSWKMDGHFDISRKCECLPIDVRKLCIYIYIQEYIQCICIYITTEHLRFCIFLLRPPQNPTS